MKTIQRVRPKIGDVIEIPLSCGFGYALYTHKHPVYGALLRVARGIFPGCPSNLVPLFQTPCQFTTFFPLGAGCSRKLVRIAANVQIPPEYQPFPMFRAGIADSSGHVAIWWIWDGTKETRAGALTPEISCMPSRSVINDTLLAERIESGWQDTAA